MTKFVAVFEELSWLTRVLRTQLETSLCECLHSIWIKVCFLVSCDACDREGLSVHCRIAQRCFALQRMLCAHSGCELELVKL